MFQRLSNGSIDPDSEVNRVIELQETVEKQNAELTNTRTKMLELNNRFTELEESYTTAQKDSIKSQEQVVKLQRDLREVSGKIILKNWTLEKIGLSLLAVFTYSAKYRKFPNYSVTHKICCDHSKIWTMWLYHRVMSPNDADWMANSVDPDQTALSRAVWSGSALFAQTYLSENLGSLR